MLRPGTDEEVFARRFRSEALYAANLCHPNVATVLDYGEDDDLAYLVLELVPGEPLSALVQREGALDPETGRARSWARPRSPSAPRTRPGSSTATSSRRTSSSTPDGVVKLTDFGIARAVDGSGHTQTGEVLGTPHYLSPEQALGEPATGASDLYALGIVAHEMLTGRRPFDKGTPVATALAQVNEPPPPLPPHVPSGLRSLIDQCLAKKPEDRPASARELGERLGIPEDDLPDVGPDASTVMGSAELAEAARRRPPGRTARLDRRRPDADADVHRGRRPPPGPRPLGVGPDHQHRRAGHRHGLVRVDPLRGGVDRGRAHGSPPVGVPGGAGAAPYCAWPAGSPSAGASSSIGRAADF